MPPGMTVFVTVASAGNDIDRVITRVNASTQLRDSCRLVLVTAGP